MYANNMGTLCYLDELRKSLGMEKFKASFREIAEKKKENAVNLVNDNKLRFGTLYILSPEIEDLKLTELLNSRNNKALKICDDIKHKSMKLTYTDLKVLEWMLQTGTADDGLSNKYDEIIDDCASVLINTYKDKTVLPVIAELIFKRNRGGRFIHDLVWIFFQSCDPYTLRIIANYLRSRDKKDIELASELLNFVSDNDNISGTNIQKIYTSSLKWLKDNYPYIYFTGENNLLTDSPKPCGVDIGAKYLCKRISHENRKPLKPLTEKEQLLLDTFKKLNSEEKNILSDFSHKMHDNNISAWNNWMNRSVNDQLEIAKKGLGVYA